MTASTRMKTDLPHLKPGALIWYNCNSEEESDWFTARVVAVHNKETPGEYLLDVQWLTIDESQVDSFGGYWPSTLDYDQGSNYLFVFVDEDADRKIKAVFENAQKELERLGYRTLIQEDPFSIALEYPRVTLEKEEEHDESKG